MDKFCLLEFLFICLYVFLKFFFGLGLGWG